jgi:coatomer protein complex subunit epsilon
MDPDELYTLRAQYWLGHYPLCISEAKSIARRPMSPQLKIEREEFYLRALLELKQYDDVIREASSGDKGPGIQALSLRAKYDSPSTPATDKQAIISELQQIVSDPSASATAKLIAAQTFLSHGEMTKEALSCVHQGATMEHLALTSQIYIRMDRYDLAKKTLGLMKQADEEAVLTQLSSVYINLAIGKSEVQDAIHTLGSLTEQYGNCPMLLNLNASAFIVAGRYDNAEKCLLEAVNEEESKGSSSDTLINLVVCYQHLGKGMGAIGPVLEQLKSRFPEHPFVQGLARVEGAFERESIKYKITA